MLGRREFLILGGSAAAAGVARARSRPRIVVLTPGASQWPQALFVQEMKRLGRNVDEAGEFEVVSAAGQLGRLDALAREVVDRNPQVILSVNTPATSAAAAATRTIPIVAGVIGDPLGMKFAETLARPGGNITGVSNLSADITTKRTALLLELVPGARRIALFLHPDDPVVTPQLRDISARSADLRIETRTFPMRSEAELPSALDQAREWRAQGMVRLAGQSFAIGAATGRLATQWRLPSMLTQRSDVAAGGLISYFADHEELWRRAAAQVHAILNGQNPGTIPFEQPQRFEIAINLKTAGALGLTVPASILARADEVIE